MPQASAEISEVMRDLSRYISSAVGEDLPPEVSEKGKHHLLDTLAAMISGSRLRPGKAAIQFVASQGGREEACVVGTSILTTAINAALANGMLAHADETDDSHKDSRCHPGCGIVSAALAMAEREGRGGEALLRAMVLGYDVGCRTIFALGVDQFYWAGHSTHSFAPLFGAAAAAGALANLSEDQIPHLISYTAQQASGVNCWSRDEEHIEKAFDFGGMTARNGVTAAEMVAAGFTGVADVFSGHMNFFFAFSSAPKPELMVEDLGTRFEIMETNIKKRSVGSPIQAVLDSTEALIRENDLKPEKIDRITVRMSDKESYIVDKRKMPAINLQHLLAVFVLDQGITFISSHDRERMNDPAVVEFVEKVKLIPDSEVPRRQPTIEIATRDGRSISHTTSAVRGTPDNPMEREEVERKALDLIEPVLGSKKSRELIDAIWTLERIKNLRELRPLLMV
jgi:2-methylcitrate dehydratase PrpD